MAALSVHDIVGLGTVGIEMVYDADRETDNNDSKGASQRGIYTSTPEYRFPSREHHCRCGKSMLHSFNFHFFGESAEATHVTPHLRRAATV